MDRKVPGVFRDITDECGGNHSADIDRESKSGLGQKPREDRSETNCKDKLEDCGCGTYGCGSVYVKVFENRTECTGSTVSADHGDRTGTYTDQRIDVKYFGEPYGNQVLKNNECDDQCKEYNHGFSTAFEHLQIGLKSYRGKE